ncbi:MAG: hypothetical protein CME71_00255 [Halobacteriovorax sp.]|nr:hypothetical protein [Halobacteriovorax sp.]|tara:strand:- start:1241 stop:2710 length:1470 start_codon:yes stop_codon:yes gene_type:complete
MKKEKVSRVKSIDDVRLKNGGIMKKSLTFKDEILKISKELELCYQDVEDITLSIMSEIVLNDEHVLELEKLFQEVDMFFLNQIDYGYYTDCDESVGCILNNSIYNTDSDVEIEKRVERERRILLDGSSEVNDLEALEIEARAYFNKPDCYPMREDDESSDLVKGYIGIYSHSVFDDNGGSLDIFKSTGDILQMSVDECSNSEYVRSKLAILNYRLSSVVQVKFYGNSLHSLIGSTIYRSGEDTDFVTLDENFPNLVYAVPNMDYLGDDSIYLALNKIVQDEVIYGRTASEVLGTAFTHWSLCREFYDVRIPQIHEVEIDRRSDEKIASLVGKRLKFKSGFSEEVCIVDKLNNGVLSIQDLEKKSAHEINRILWVCKSKDFSCRIESKTVFVQIQSLSRKLKSVECQTSHVRECNEAKNLIDYINRGKDISLIEISDELLRMVFALLWDRGSQVRIIPEYKTVYFELKKRFSCLDRDIKSGKNNGFKLSA